MALIGKIRKNSWILVALIGLGLLGFIVMDMTSGQQSIFGSAQPYLAKVDGKKLDLNRFFDIEGVLYSGSTSDVYSRREALYNDFVEEALVGKVSDKLGLGVGLNELTDLQFGPNPSPIIVQRFTNQLTGQMNSEQLTQIRDAIKAGTLSPVYRQFWAVQEDEIIRERLKSKLGNMVSKGMFTPTWMGEMGYRENNERIQFAYVRVPFDEINNTDVGLEDADFQAYINENKHQFEKKENTCKIDYVALEVLPTAADSALIYASLDTMVTRFRSAENDSVFALRNQGLYDPAYLNQEAIPAAIADTVLSLAVGGVYGPYLDGSTYKLVKVVDKMVVPDSVKSRHILLRVQDQATLFVAQRTIDSLKTLIESGAETFDSLAFKFGTDGTAAQGGDLGYTAQGRMVKPFNDHIFFKAEQGKLYTVATEFGLHLVEVTGKKFINNEQGIKLAYLSRDIKPSQETQDRVYERALTLAGQNTKIEKLKEAIKSDTSLSVATSELIPVNGYSISGLGLGEASRDMVRWAFKAKPGDVSPKVYVYKDPNLFFNNKYVIASLNSLQKPGIPALADLRTSIEPQVLNRKKAEILVEKMKGKDLSALAAEFSLPVDTATNISFASGTITGLGSEPKIIGQAFTLPVDEVSGPVEGASGVFVLKVLNKPETPQPGNLDVFKNTVFATTKNSVRSGISLLDSYKKTVKITDNRSKFY